MSRESWTDSRLDDLNHKVDRIDQHVDDLGRRMDARFEAMESRMDARFEVQQQMMSARFDAIDARFETMDARFEAMESRMDARFDTLQRLMIQGSVGVIVALITAGAAIVATQL